MSKAVVITEEMMAAVNEMNKVLAEGGNLADPYTQILLDMSVKEAMATGKYKEIMSFVCSSDTVKRSADAVRAATAATAAIQKAKGIHHLGNAIARLSGSAAGGSAAGTVLAAGATTTAPTAAVGLGALAALPAGLSTAVALPILPAVAAALLAATAATAISYGVVKALDAIFD